jgi:sec-independent protein translocase protein TatA
MDFFFVTHLGFLNLGPTEIIVVLVIAVILFGGRLPEVARTLGKGFFDFKRNLKDLQNDIYRQDYDPPHPLPKPYYPEQEEREEAQSDGDETQKKADPEQED